MVSYLVLSSEFCNILKDFSDNRMNSFIRIMRRAIADDVIIFNFETKVVNRFLSFFFIMFKILS